MTQPTLISQFYIKIDGADATTSVMDCLYEIEVETGFQMPGSAVLKFYDQDLTLTSGTVFDLGKELEISALSATGTATRTVIFKGQVTNLEPEFVVGSSYSMYVVRAYDKSFKLHRGTSSTSYVQVSDSDIVSTIASEAGLTAEVEATNVVHPHVLRHDQSGYEFLSHLARRNGYVLYYDSPSSKLLFKKPATLATTSVSVTYGETMREFRPRYALTGQVNEITVNGWDPAQKQAVTGSANSPTFSPASTELGRGPTVATSKFSSAKLHITETSSTQALAEAVALSVLNRMAGSDLTAEGVALGNPAVKPGVNLQVTHLGKFSGTYLVTRVTHRFGQRDAYTMDIWMGGMQSGTFASIINDDPRATVQQPATQHGLLVGIVTNNTDDDGDYGRVKVKYPTIDSTLESFWAPVVSVGAGNKRGLMFLPEVNDEVLVGFVNGDINRPYVLGGLWNGQDVPPQAKSAAVVNGQVEIRELKTRVGHVLRFTDTSGSEKIELIDKSGNNLLEIDTAQNTVTIKAQKDIVLQATGDILMKGVNIKLEGSAKVDIKAAQVQAQADSQIALKGAMAELSASGITKVSGSMVNIN